MSFYINVNDLLSTELKFSRFVTFIQKHIIISLIKILLFKSFMDILSNKNDSLERTIILPRIVNYIV